MKRVLVTGASGFIGRQSLGPLLDRGYEVHAVSHRRAIERPGIESYRTDLLDAAAVRQLLARERPSHLLHFAWHVPPGEYWTSVENFDWVRGSLDLVRAFAESGGVRCVIAGSCAEYDWSADCCSEATPLRPRTAYGVCKNALRELVESFASVASLSAAWARIFYVYGPHEPEARLVPSVIRGMAAREVVECTDGSQERDFLHVSDVGSAFAALLDSDVTGALDIGSGTAVPVRDVIARIAKAMDGERWVRLGARPGPDGEPHVIRASIRRLRDEVGWTPKFDLATGLDDTIRWWQKRAREIGCA
ncbi:MAG: NAD-dependent epimerase/dehydratase family protein [Thermoanaerobaculia bacterium]